MGHADIIYGYLDEQGDLWTVCLDTYDMNKNDPDWKVRVARQAQDNGTFRNYYSLFITRTNREVLKAWEVIK